MPKNGTQQTCCLWVSQWKICGVGGFGSQKHYISTVMTNWYNKCPQRLIANEKLLAFVENCWAEDWRLICWKLPTLPVFLGCRIIEFTMHPITNSFPWCRSFAACGAFYFVRWTSSQWLFFPSAFIWPEHLTPNMHTSTIWPHYYTFFLWQVFPKAWRRIVKVRIVWGAGRRCLQIARGSLVRLWVFNAGINSPDLSYLFSFGTYSGLFMKIASQNPQAQGHFDWGVTVLAMYLRVECYHPISLSRLMGMMTCSKGSWSPPRLWSIAEETIAVSIYIYVYNCTKISCTVLQLRACTLNSSYLSD